MDYPPPLPQRCEKCKHVIGKNEEAFVWLDRPVCGDCYRRVQRRSRSLSILWSWLGGAGIVIAIGLGGTALALNLRSKAVITPPSIPTPPKPVLVPFPIPAKPDYDYKVVEWNNKEPKTRLIHRDEGFCCLASVGGAFNGGGEWVTVELDDNDGYWYVSGQSAAGFSWCRVLEVRYKMQK